MLYRIALWHLEACWKAERSIKGKADFNEASRQMPRELASV